MNLENLENLLPDYATDIKSNLSTLVHEDLLTPQQKYGCFLATALASRNPDVIAVIEKECHKILSEQQIYAAKGANAIMAMNNVYYRFPSMSSSEAYGKMQSGLRMTILANHGTDKVDFELWSLAVSVINSCKYCVDSHEKKLIKGGLSSKQIQAAVRIAAVIHAISVILDGDHQ